MQSRPSTTPAELELVTLVDEADRDRGAREKHEAHHRGELHRAVSVFLFNDRGETLLQRRASVKYHSPGLWSNTCCGHPRPGEPPVEAARRRLREEMGIDCPLRPAFRFIYRVRVGSLVEFELDHVLTGRFDGDPSPDPEEADAWSWRNWERVQHHLEARPDVYTPWLRIAAPFVRPDARDRGFLGRLALPISERRGRVTAPRLALAKGGS